MCSSVGNLRLGLSKVDDAEDFVNSNREATMTLNSNPATVDSTTERSSNEAKVKSPALSTTRALAVSIYIV